MSVTPLSSFRKDVTSNAELRIALTSIVEAIVERRSEVKVELHEVAGNDFWISVTVSPDDMGALMGRQGKVANAIRQFVSAYASQHGGHYHVNFSKAVITDPHPTSARD